MDVSAMEAILKLMGGVGAGNKEALAKSKQTTIVAHRFGDVSVSIAHKPTVELPCYNIDLDLDLTNTNHKELLEDLTSAIADLNKAYKMIAKNSDTKSFLKAVKYD